MPQNTSIDHTQPTETESWTSLTTQKEANTYSSPSSITTATNTQSSHAPTEPSGNYTEIDTQRKTKNIMFCKQLSAILTITSVGGIASYLIYKYLHKHTKQKETSN